MLMLTWVTLTVVNEYGNWKVDDWQGEIKAITKSLATISLDGCKATFHARCMTKGRLVISTTFHGKWFCPQHAVNWNGRITDNMVKGLAVVAEYVNALGEGT